MTPGGIGLVRRADLSIKPRSGCGVLFGRGRDDLGKCVRTELIERGGEVRAPLQGRKHLSIACPMVTDTRSCIPVDTTRTGYS